MKITILSSGTPHSTLAHRALSFAKELVNRGHQVTMIAPSVDKYSSFQRVKYRQIDGVTIIQPLQFATKHTPLNLLPYLLAASLAVLRTPADLVIIYKPTPITVIGLLRKLAYKTPVILDMDDLGSNVMQAEHHAGILVKLVKWCEAFATKHADTIITASSLLQRRYQASYPKKPVIWISNGVDLGAYHRVLPAPLRPHIVFFGALNRPGLIEPLIDVLPAIVQHLPSIKATIMGGGDHLAALRKHAIKRGVSEHLKFTGQIDMFDAQDHTNFGDLALCYLPDEETIRAASNMKLFQYMIMGAVPVVSAVGDLPHYAADGAAGYIVAPHHLDALRDTLIHALDHPAERAAKANYALSYCAAKYSWTALGEHLTAVITNPPTGDPI